MDSDSLSRYVTKIETYSRRDVQGNLYRPVADFLLKALDEASSGREDDEVKSRLESFAYHYAVHPNLPMSSGPLLSATYIQDLGTSSMHSACGGKVIFLAGYPSPYWLAVLGDLYRIGPEYWRRHLDFLSLPDRAYPQQRFLPSSTNRIFQLRVASNGSWGRWWRHKQNIENLRQDAATIMLTYQNSLKEGRGWKQGDSIVRHYTLHDKEHFSIEQYVTVYLHGAADFKHWAGKLPNENIHVAATDI